MELEEAKYAVDVACCSGAKIVQLTGGEPMCYPSLIELVAYCKSNGLHSVIATSGFSHSQLLYARLKNAGLTALCVSLNSIDEGINQTSREGFSYAVEAVKDAVSVGLSCILNIVLTKENLQSLRKTVIAAQNMGVSQVCLLKRFPSIKGEMGELLTEQELDELHNLALEYADFVCVEKCYKEYWARFYNESKICMDCGRTGVFWNVDGKVSPCSQKTKFKYLTIDEMSLAEKIWKREC